MENTKNLKASNVEINYNDIDDSALDNLVAAQRVKFTTRLCRYDCEDILQANLGNRYKGLPVAIQRGCSMVGEVPAFTCEEDKQAHVERVQKAIEDSRNDMKKEVYQMAI